jgi:phosphatidylserine decarboxylase
MGIHDFAEGEIIINRKSIKANDIDMSDFIDTDYASYNEFFTRNVKKGARNFEKNDYILGAPCDSKVSYYKINDDTHILVKDTEYSLDDLLLTPSLTDEFLGGTCLVFRLSVDDYHHYHFFDDGCAEDERVIKGVFHTVNPIANDYYPIYKRNTRSYTLLHTKHFDDVVFMEVGALMVGKIVNYKISTFRKGEEKGYFEFGGSTVICLFKKGIVDVDEDIKKHSENNDEVKVKLGERVGKRIF